MMKNLNGVYKAPNYMLPAFVWQYAHWLHRVSLGTLFIWFGLLKPFGHATTTSILAHTVYWGDPEIVVLILGWWEVAIGTCLIISRFVHIAVFLLVARLPGVVLAFILLPDVCFYSFPLAPTPEGQYLIKDLVIFIATLAIVASIREENLLRSKAGESENYVNAACLRVLITVTN